MIGSALHVPERVMIGVWYLASGNVVRCYLEPGAGDMRGVTAEWDGPFSLTMADRREYLTTIRPALVGRLREYLERRGPALIVELA